MSSNFFVSLAPADNIGRFPNLDEGDFGRISLINLFPPNVKENLLFSMSFNSDIHYDTMTGKLDPLGAETILPEYQKKLPKRMFADCGAYQFRNLPEPILPNGCESNAENAWYEYKKRHLEKGHPWEEILLCAPDHIICRVKSYTAEENAIIANMTNEEKALFEHNNPPKDRDLTIKEFEQRVEFNKKQATAFFEAAKDDKRVTPIGVIHGHCDFDKDAEQRKKRLFELLADGYEYVALGGMVPYSGNKKKALKIIAGIDDLDNPIIAKDSILGICKEKKVKLHVFGLTSPDWYRWLYRLRVDSFDGSKLATEGAVNGIYWILNDGNGSGRDIPKKPEKVTDLYSKVNIKNLKSTDWKWEINDNGILSPIAPNEYKGVTLKCSCPACTYLKSARCPSKRCTIRKKFPNLRHTCEPLMRGSNEHNMGRAAHNAHVYGVLIEKIKQFNKEANDALIEGENEWLKHWKSVEVET